MFEAPRGLPGKLCFRDPLSSYLEVVVELPAIVAEEHSAELYHEIRDTFFMAIQQAMETLHYKMRTPELSFLCPEHVLCIYFVQDQWNQRMSKAQ